MSCTRARGVVVWARRSGGELLRHGFERLGLHRIFATCDPRNVASARVLSKLGMTWEGRHRHTALIRDGWRDSEMFGVLEDEWRVGTRPAGSGVAVGGAPS